VGKICGQISASGSAGAKEVKKSLKLKSFKWIVTFNIESWTLPRPFIETFSSANTHLPSKIAKLHLAKLRRPAWSHLSHISPVYASPREIDHQVICIPLFATSPQKLAMLKSEAAHDDSNQKPSRSRQRTATSCGECRRRKQKVIEVVQTLPRTGCLS
jgi:hypothetical protein